jgi:hypothetical protein
VLYVVVLFIGLGLGFYMRKITIILGEEINAFNIDDCWDENVVNCS